MTAVVEALELQRIIAVFTFGEGESTAAERSRSDNLVIFILNIVRADDPDTAAIIHQVTRYGCIRLARIDDGKSMAFEPRRIFGILGEETEEQAVAGAPVPHPGEIVNFQ